MTGNWYDSVGSGIGSLVDMFAGNPHGMTAAGASAATPMLTEHAQHVAGSSDFGKATGLTPFMKMLGIGGPAATPAASAGGGGAVTAPVTGTWEDKEYKKLTNDDGTPGGYQLPSRQRWQAMGRSGGNRPADHEAAAKGGLPITGPDVYGPDLSKIALSIEEGQSDDENGYGYFHERRAGSHSDWSDRKPDELGYAGTVKFDPTTGKGVTGIGTGYQKGYEDKEGYRAIAKSADGHYAASAEAGTVVSHGGSAAYGVDTTNGLYATAGYGGKAGLYATGKAGAKSSALSVGGVDYEASVGAQAEGFVGGKYGINGLAGFGPDFMGAKGGAGAFSGGELAAAAQAEVGPVGGKLGGSAMAGIGAGLDGELSWHDGKLTIGGKAFACLGLGGSLSAEATLDIAKMGTSLYNLAPDAIDTVGAMGTGLYNGAAYAGSGIYNGAAYAGEGLYNGGAYLGRGLANGASYLGNGVSNLFSW